MRRVAFLFVWFDEEFESAVCVGDVGAFLGMLFWGSWVGSEEEFSYFREMKCILDSDRFILKGFEWTVGWQKTRN